MASLPNHDIQFLELDVDRVVVIDEEYLHLVLEDVRPLLDDEVDVPESHVLHPSLLGEKGDERRIQFLALVTKSASCPIISMYFIRT